MGKGKHMTDYQEQYDTNFPSLDDGVEDDTVPLGLVLKLDRQRALIAELVGTLEGILKRSVARGTLEIPCDGPIADLIRAVLAKTREESA